VNVVCFASISPSAVLGVGAAMLLLTTFLVVLLSCCLCRCRCCPLIKRRRREGMPHCDQSVPATLHGGNGGRRSPPLPPSALHLVLYYNYILHKSVCY